MQKPLQRTHKGTLHDSYFQSLTAELHSLKNRVRSFIVDDPHWPTDGEWKESVLRTFLRRNLPTTIAVGRGFIVGTDRHSSQIDLLLYDCTKPVLFRDGDTVMITGEAVAGVIEVKTTLTADSAKKALTKLANIGEMIRPYSAPVGLFAYDLKCSGDQVLKTLKVSAEQSYRKACTFVSAGPDIFVEMVHSRNGYISDSWKCYSVPMQAPGFFIHKFVRSMLPRPLDDDEPKLWFPEKSLDTSLLKEVPIRDDMPKPGA
jgi:hypothetical protein